MLKAVVFDMDGVLIDSEYTYFVAKTKVLEAAGVHVDKSYHYQFMGSTSEYTWEKMKQTFGLSRSVQEYIEEMEGYRSEILARDGTRPIAGAPDLVKQLTQLKIPIAVASSTPIKGIESSLKAIGIVDKFQYLVSGAEVAHSKPAPDVYLKAIKQLKLAPEECMAVEDTVNGTTSASRAGMYVVGYVNPSYPPQDLSKADETFSDYAEFLPKFQHLFE